MYIEIQDDLSGLLSLSLEVKGVPMKSCFCTRSDGDCSKCGVVVIDEASTMSEVQWGYLINKNNERDTVLLDKIVEMGKILDEQPTPVEDR